MDFKKYNNYNRCFIIGNGSSLNEMDLDLLKDELTIGCNLICKSGFIPKCLCVSDPDNFKTQEEFLPFNTNFVFASPPCKVPDNIKYHKVALKKEESMLDAIELDKDFNKTYWARNVVIELCIPLANYLNIKEIYLIGIDGKKENIYHHFYDTVVLPTNTDFIPYYNKIKELYNGTIYDCTVNGYLTMFEKKDYLEVLNEK